MFKKFKMFKKATKNINKHICFVVVKWSEIEKNSEIAKLLCGKMCAGV